MPEFVSGMNAWKKPCLFWIFIQKVKYCGQERLKVFLVGNKS